MIQTHQSSSGQHITHSMRNTFLHTDNQISHLENSIPHWYWVDRKCIEKLMGSKYNMRLSLEVINANSGGY